jgi:hypothetical protein
MGAEIALAHMPAHSVTTGSCALRRSAAQYHELHLANNRRFTLGEARPSDPDENRIDQARSLNFGVCRYPRMSYVSVPIQGADVTFGMCRHPCVSYLRVPIQGADVTFGICRHLRMSYVSVLIRGADVTWIFNAGAHGCGFTLLKRVVVTYGWASATQRTIPMCLRPTILSLGFGLNECDNTQCQRGRRDNEPHFHHLYRSSRPKLTPATSPRYRLLNFFLSNAT